jgi:hypothetical protein
LKDFLSELFYLRQRYWKVKDCNFNYPLRLRFWMTQNLFFLHLINSQNSLYRFVCCSKGYLFDIQGPGMETRGINPFTLFFFFFFTLETLFFYVVQADLELMILLRLHPNAGITGMKYYTQLGHYFIYFFFIVLLFICAYKAWVISPPCPHPLPDHPLHLLPLPPTPSIPSRNYFLAIIFK